MSRYLIDQLSHRDPNVVWACLASLLRDPRKEVEQPVIQAIASVLRRPEDALRESASLLLVEVAASNSCLPVLGLLADKLHDTSSVVRTGMIELFEKIDPRPDLAATLVPLLKDPELDVRVEATLAIWHHARDATLVHDSIAAALQSDQEHALCLTCQLIAEMGVLAQSYGPQLKRLLANGSGIVRANALRAIARISNDPTALLEVASSLKNDPDAAVRVVASRLMTPPPVT